MTPSEIDEAYWDWRRHNTPPNEMLHFEFEDHPEHEHATCEVFRSTARMVVLSVHGRSAVLPLTKLLEARDHTLRLLNQTKRWQKDYRY